MSRHRMPGSPPSMAEALIGLLGRAQVYLPLPDGRQVYLVAYGDTVGVHSVSIAPARVGPRIAAIDTITPLQGTVSGLQRYVCRLLDGER